MIKRFLSIQTLFKAIRLITGIVLLVIFIQKWFLDLPFIWVDYAIIFLLSLYGIFRKMYLNKRD
jgi:hypothetical protein